jgi:hypothetical protein
MATGLYKINKGIHKSIEFKGIKAQYIGYLAGGMLVLLIFFAMMYLIGINPWVSVVFVVIAGSCLFFYVLKMSGTYGEFGLMKKAAKRSVPKMIKCNSRNLFVKA